jgi:hypothetical protein
MAKHMTYFELGAFRILIIMLRNYELKPDISDRCQDPSFSSVHIVSLERRLPVKPGDELVLVQIVKCSESRA